MHRNRLEGLTMRPEYLRMSAFGPYAGVTEIEMDRLGDKGLYLITGSTGAGKTTIFDAICFALYGEASGTNRDAGMLRSKYAQDGVPTEVELVFSHAGKKYTVKRNPEYLRKSKRGGDLTKQNADAQITMPDGSVITKTGNVTKAVEEILGINKEQFSKIVMIAQGDFLKLLFADTKSRMEIFRELFKTENYMNLQKKLDAEQKVVYGQAEDAKKSIAQYISGIRVDKDDVLSADVEKALAGSLTVGEVTDLLDKLTDSDMALKDELEKELATINSRLENVNANIGAAEALAKAGEALEKAQNALAVEEPKTEGVKEQFEGAKEALKEKSGFEKRSAAIETVLKDYDAADRLSEEIQNAERKNKSDNESLLKLEKIQAEKTARKDQLKTEQNLIKDSGEELAKLNAKLEKIKSDAEAANDLSKALSEYSEEKEKLIKAQEAYRYKDAEFVRLNDLYESMEQAFLDGQAGILASKLTDGARCPVCGSTSHPEPAHLHDSVPTEKELEEAKSAADSARTDREKCATEAGALKKGLEEKEAQLKKQAEKVTGEEDPDKAAGVLPGVRDELAAAQKEVEEALKEAQNKIKRRSELETLIPQLEKEMAEDAAGIEEIKKNIAADASVLKEKAANLENIKSSLPYQSKKEAETAKKQLDDEALRIQKAYDNADKALKEQNEIVLKLKAEIESNKKTIRDGRSADIEEERTKQAKLNLAQKDCINRNKTVSARIEANENIRSNIAVQSASAQVIEKKLQWMRALSDTANGRLNGKDKVMLETYIQMTYFDRIIQRANLRLMMMSSGQYELIRMKEAANAKSQSGLDLGVIDHYNGSQRNVKSLSGGESFMASLSLALGLSDEIQSNAGGIQIDTMFVDEGFGSLDPETLDQAYRALAGLTEGNRLVGIISHVDGLKERIDKQIVINKDRSGGSTVSINA